MAAHRLRALGVLIVSNLGFERWTRRIERAVEESTPFTDLNAAVGSRASVVALAGMVLLTISIVFVMVVKPTLG